MSRNRPVPFLALPVLFLALVLAMGHSNAQIYRTVDENGNIVFTDQPATLGARPMELSPLAAISDPVPVAPRPDPPTPQAAETRYRLSIVSPQQDQTLWGTAGNVPVQVSTRPNLQSGHRVAIYLDGKLVDELVGGIKNIGGVDRGTHQISAAVINASGDKVSNKPRVTFHVKQHSILLPTARPGLGHPPPLSGPGPGGG